MCKIGEDNIAVLFYSDSIRPLYTDQPNILRSGRVIEDVPSAFLSSIQLLRSITGHEGQRKTREWENLIRLQLTEILVSRTAALAWEHGLRGYDATHLASALFWQDMLGETVTVATYNRHLWGASKDAGLVVWPDSLR